MSLHFMHCTIVQSVESGVEHILVIEPTWKVTIFSKWINPDVSNLAIDDFVIYRNAAEIFYPILGLFVVNVIFGMWLIQYNKYSVSAIALTPVAPFTIMV